MRVSNLRAFPASPEDQRTGLLAYLTFQLDGRWLLDGVALRRTKDGRTALAFPRRRDRLGRDHYAFRPADDWARAELEREVLTALQAQDGRP